MLIISGTQSDRLFIDKLFPFTPPPGPIGLGDDPHYSILLPSGQLLCYSVQGEHNFTFNLISNSLLQMNALFVPDNKLGRKLLGLAGWD